MSLENTHLNKRNNENTFVSHQRLKKKISFIFSPTRFIFYLPLISTPAPGRIFLHSGSPHAAQSPRTAPRGRPNLCKRPGAIPPPCWAGLESPNRAKHRPQLSVREQPTWSAPLVPARRERPKRKLLRPPRKQTGKMTWRHLHTPGHT